MRTCLTLFPHSDVFTIPDLSGTATSTLIGDRLHLSRTFRCFQWLKWVFDVGHKKSNTINHQVYALKFNQDQRGVNMTKTPTHFRGYEQYIH